MINTSLLKTMNLITQGLGFWKICWFGKSFSRSRFGLVKPGSELLDSSLVFGPEFDILRKVIAFNPDFFLKVFNIFGNSKQFLFELFGIYRNIFS